MWRCSGAVGAMFRRAARRAKSPEVFAAASMSALSPFSGRKAMCSAIHESPKTEARSISNVQKVARGDLAWPDFSSPRSGAEWLNPTTLRACANGICRRNSDIRFRDSLPRFSVSGIPELVSPDSGDRAGRTRNDHVEPDVRPDGRGRARSPFRPEQARNRGAVRNSARAPRPGRRPARRRPGSATPDRTAPPARATRRRSKGGRAAAAYVTRPPRSPGGALPVPLGVPWPQAAGGPSREVIRHQAKAGWFRSRRPPADAQRSGRRAFAVGDAPGQGARPGHRLGVR
jgi:hypothetical protein